MNQESSLTLNFGISCRKCLQRETENVNIRNMTYIDYHTEDIWKIYKHFKIKPLQDREKKCSPGQLYIISINLCFICCPIWLRGSYITILKELLLHSILEFNISSIQKSIFSLKYIYIFNCFHTCWYEISCLYFCLYMRCWDVEML